MLLNQAVPLNTEEESRSDLLALVSRGSLYFLIGGLLAFGKDFAYLGIDTPLIKIYISEIFIAFNILTIAVDLLRGRLDPKIKYVVWFIPVIIYGGILATFGFFEHGVLAIRQYAMVYYCITAVLIFVRFNRIDVNRLFLAAICCSIARILLYIVNNHYIDIHLASIGSLSYFAGIIIITGSYYYMSRLPKRRQFFVLALLILPFTHMLIRPKSSYFASIFALIIFYCALSVIRGRFCKPNWKRAVIVSSVTLAIAALSFVAALIIENPEKLFVEIRSEFVASISPQIASDLVEPPVGSQVEPSVGSQVEPPVESRADSYSRGQQKNAHWRIVVWEKAFEELSEQPVFGKGFGSYFTAPRLKDLKYDYSKNIDPHNSYIHLLMRTGLVGFFLFALTHLFILYKAFIVMRRGSNDQWRMLKSWLIIFIGFWAVAFLNVVLENSYGAIPYWFVAGVLLIICDKVEVRRQGAESNTLE